MNIYYKPLLSEYIADDKVTKKLFLHDHEWYEKNQILYYPKVKVISIDCEHKQINLSTDETIHYDRLILAMGSHSFVPPIKNVDLKEGVYTLRNLGMPIK